MAQRRNSLSSQMANKLFGKQISPMPSDIIVEPNRTKVAARRLSQGASNSKLAPGRAPHIQAADRPQLWPVHLFEKWAANDWAIIIISAVISKLIYLDGYLGGVHQTLPFAVLGFIFGFILYLFYNELGLYEPRVMSDSSIEFGKLLGGLALSFLMLIGLLYLLKIDEIFSRGWMLLWFGVSAIMLCLAQSAMRNYAQHMIAEGGFRERVGIVGAGDLVRQLQQILESSPGVEVAGVYDDRHSSSGSLINSTVLGGLEDLVADAREGAFDHVIIAHPAGEREWIAKVVERLAVLPLDLHLYASPFSLPVAIHGGRNFGDVQVYLVMAKPPPVRAKFVKLVIDYAIAASALAMLLPLFAVIALAIKADSRGPVFFRQRRYGQSQKVFRVYKFRTMTVMEDGHSIKQAERSDCRTTRVGRILRRTSLDELPQLINVLRGEMSIVGPRPHALVHDEHYAAKIPRYSQRHRIKPGITGWAQVNGSRGETKTCEAMRKRMEYDLYYIDNWSIWLDIEILFRTPFEIATARGAY